MENGIHDKQNFDEIVGNARNSARVSAGDRLLLFVVHTAFSMCQRMWEFSMVIFLTDLVPSSLTFVALLGMAESLAIFLFSGPVGKWLDRTNRLRAIAVLLMIKTAVFVVIMGLLVWQFSVPQEGKPSIGCSMRTPSELTAFLFFRCRNPSFSMDHCLKHSIHRGRCSSVLLIHYTHH